MSAAYINPNLPSMIRGLYDADLREKSIRNMLDLAADLVQELIDLRADQGKPQITETTERAVLTVDRIVQSTGMTSSEVVDVINSIGKPQISKQMVEAGARALDENFNPDRYPVMAAMYRDYARAVLEAALSEGGA